MKEIEHIFKHNEKAQLEGKGKGNLLLMAILMLLAIISIGFASASLVYLENKMKDPFVSCIDITVDQMDRDLEKLECFLNENCQKYEFTHPEKVWMLHKRFFDADGNTVYLDGRTLDEDSPIKTSTILSAKNLIQPDIQAGIETDIFNSGFGIILSKEGAKKLGNNYPVFLRQYVYAIGNGSNWLNVPVLAVVKELPDMVDFVATKNYAERDLGKDADHFNYTLPEYNKKVRLVCTESSKAKLQTALANLNVTVTDNGNNYYDNVWASDYVYFSFNIDEVDSLRFTYSDSLCQVIIQKVPDVVRIYDFPFKDCIIRDPQLYSCYFSMDKDLPDNVEKFRVALKDETGYRLDMSKIDSLKNLAKVQTLGNVLSWCIFGIAIIFIVVFIYFLMSMHFQKIQKNLGTFKAFGIDTKTLNGIYISIIVEIVIVSFIIAAVLAAAITIPINYLLPRDGMYAWVNIFVWQNGVLLAVALIAAIVTVTITANKLLKNSPGDLIYDRKH